MAGILKFFRNWWLFIVIGCLVLCTVWAPYLLTRSSFCGVSFESTGQIGDTIAGTTAPFVGLLSAFLLIFTLYKQLQFNKQQTKLSLDDQFKSSYFQMLDQQRVIADNIEYDSITPWDSQGDDNYQAKGIKSFKAYYEILDSLFKFFDSEKFEKGISKDEYLIEIDALNDALELGMPEQEADAETIRLKTSLHKWALNRIFYIKEAVYDFYRLPGMDIRRKLAFVYHIFYFQHQELGRYFRHIYYILTILKREEERQLSIFANNPTQVEQIKKSFKTYAQFIPAQMSFEELTLMYYNCSLFPKLLELAKQYEIFQTLPEYMLCSKTHIYDGEISLSQKTKRLETILGTDLSALLVELRVKEN